MEAKERSDETDENRAERGRLEERLEANRRGRQDLPAATAKSLAAPPPPPQQPEAVQKKINNVGDTLCICTFTVRDPYFVARAAGVEIS